MRSRLAIKPLKKKKAIVFTSIVVLSALIVFTLVNITMEYIATHKFIWQSPIIIKTQAPLIVKRNLEIVSPISTHSGLIKSSYAQEEPQVDRRAEKLETYLKKYNSPLAGYAKYIVGISDDHDLPYTLIAAISGKESSFGKNLAGDFNAWGITTGRKSPRFASFGSWEEGITAIANLLDTQYRKDMASGIQTRYCPSIECSDTWAEDVAGFAEEINK